MYYNIDNTQAVKQELDDLSKQIYSQRCSAHASAFLSKQLNEEELKTIAATANGDKVKQSAVILAIIMSFPLLLCHSCYSHVVVS